MAVQQRNENLNNDEHTPLLQQRRKPTPLPRGQTFALLLLMTAEPLMSLSIMPYVSELVSKLPVTGGDEKKVGYYAGIIMSLYFIGEAITVLQWSRLSDVVGRKPVLICGILCLVITTILFGLSRSFGALAASRFLAGAWNGNVGVMNSMLAEMSDETNISRAFTLVPLSWAIGAALGPYLGGLLSRPRDRWPKLFSNRFWKRYPYFLPCAVTSAYALISLIIASVLLKETLPKKVQEMRTRENDESSTQAPDMEGNAKQEDQPEPSTRDLLTKPVLLTMSAHGWFSFLEIASWVLLPLVYTTPIEFGGLGFDPATMGICMALYGVMKGVLQLTVFHHILDFLGLRTALIAFISSLIPLFLLFPVGGIHVRNEGTAMVLWILVLIQLVSTISVNMAYGCTFIYITSAAPRGMLGATCGLAQTVASVQHAIGPAIAAALFSFSLENNIMGGHGVYYALTLCTLALLWLSSYLPPDRWPPEEDVE